MLSRRISKRLIALYEGTWGLNEDQLALRQMVLDFTKSEITQNASTWDENKEFPIPTFKKAAELGLCSLYTSPENGGSGLTKHDSTIVFEALGTGCNSTACYLSIHNMCNGIIDKFGNDYQKQKWSPGLNTFDLISSYCLTEPGSGSDSASMSTTAIDKGDHYVISGSKMFISSAGMSDLYLVMAKTDKKEITCFAVEKGTQGLSFGQNERKLGWNSMPTAIVNFDECKVPKENLIGERGLGFKIAMQALDSGRVNISACGLGTAQESLERATRYMEERSQFGQKLKDFQALRFKIAEEATNLHSARLMLRQAASMLDEDYELKTPYAAMAKLHVTEACKSIVDTALQCHGGYGVLADYEIERMYRDLRILRIVEGTSEIMKLIIARGVFESKFQQKMQCQGCRGKVPINNWKLHELHCLRFYVRCESCGVSIRQSDYSQHYEDYHQQQICKFCEEVQDKISIWLHLTLCEQRPKPCNVCGAKIQHCEIDSHANQCEASVFKPMRKTLKRRNTGNRPMKKLKIL